MSNQPLIDFENEQKQTNIDSITFFEWQIKSVDEAIAQAQGKIDTYNIQKIDFQDKIITLGENNVKIDQIISILSS
jgi:hypothetical protein